MAIAERALLETQDAFDGVATDYDRSNAANPILTEMRRRVLATAEALVPAGGRILDLGCGPGTDEEPLARAGFHVTAIDWSPAMVDEARARIASAGLKDRVEVFHLGIQQLDRLPSNGFDAAYSNFGALNCVPDLADAARQIASKLRTGGVIIASVIGRVCPWELALYASRGDMARARVRFADHLVGVPLNGRTVWTRYYTPKAFAAVFDSAGCRRESVRALGLFAPPPYMSAFATRHPALVERLRVIDDHAGTWPVLRAWGDHFLMVLRKA